MILRQLEDMPGFILGGHNINNLRYADDTVLIAESRDNLQELLDKVIEESNKKGLTINCNMDLEFVMKEVIDGYNGAKDTTRLLPTHVFKIIPDDFGHGAVLEETSRIKLTI